MAKRRTGSSLIPQYSDPFAVLTKYNQIYTDLLASITTERLARGARLPSETELMASYGA